MSDSSTVGWPSAVVALGLTGLVGVMFWKAADSASFATIWAAAGTFVGVLVGAVPAYFFHQSANRADLRADAADKQAEVAGERLAAVLAVSDPKVIDDAKASAPRAFQEWSR